MPEVKVSKIRVLVANPRFDTGSTAVDVLEVQVLLGNLQFGAIANPTLRPALGAVARLLSTHDPERKQVRLKGEASAVRAAWDEFWEAVELVRVLSEVPEKWEPHFTTGLASLLAPQERLSLPGVALTYTGGDSTLQRLACADWTRRVFGVMDMAEVQSGLQGWLGDDAVGDLIIAIGELFCAVLLAVAQGPRWRGQLVLYTSDNSNTEAWIEKRTAGSQLARYGLRLLGRAETTNGFTMVAAGVGTKRNVTMDLASRADADAKAWRR